MGNILFDPTPVDYPDYSILCPADIIQKRLLNYNIDNDSKNIIVTTTTDRWDLLGLEDNVIFTKVEETEEEEKVVTNIVEEEI